MPAICNIWCGETTGPLSGSNAWHYLRMPQKVGLYPAAWFVTFSRVSPMSYILPVAGMTYLHETHKSVHRDLASGHALNNCYVRQWHLIISHDLISLLLRVYTAEKSQHFTGQL